MDSRNDASPESVSDCAITKSRSFALHDRKLVQLALMRLGSRGRRWCLAAVAACILGEALASLESMVRAETIAPSFVVLAFFVLVFLRLAAITSMAAILVYWRPTPHRAESARGEPRDTVVDEAPVLAGRYQILQTIGHGGMGEVYKGRRIDDGWLVAIKLMHPHLVHNAEAHMRFRREAIFTARVPAAHAPEVLDYGVTPDGLDYIVMDYLRGEDLAHVLERRGRLPLDEVVPLVTAVANALEAAHSAGIVHRDLKPENVFLLDQGAEVRLLDFGIARQRDAAEQTPSGDLVGTLGFLSPEQARGDHARIGPHTDVFALGLIAYRALTGSFAFPSRETIKALYEVMTVTPPPPSSLVAGLPEDVDHAIALALSKECAERYAHPSRFAEALRLAARGALDPASRESARKLAATQEDEERAVTTKKMVGPDLRLATLPMPREETQWEVAFQAFLAEPDRWEARATLGGMSAKSGGR